MSLLPSYKEISDFLNEGSILEAKEKIMELREGSLALQEEILMLKEKIKELEGQLTKKKNVVFEDHYYWVKEGEKREGPYCQRCYDSENKLIRLRKLEKGNWQCVYCKNDYFDESFKPSPSNFGYFSP